ncbi:hypothetical protein RB162_00125 [Enterococcus faecalis]|uniref:hypothetical protein n=1 Tax=Enterococcus faecalis TaxID=1351 RepID=UPI002872A864|nr:hypothetical protein [Enterococcus faecalis]MDR9788648.1 hypothetical protein [Enterococcus faecalis]
MLQIIYEWWKCSSNIEKIVAFIIGFSLGDSINGILYTFFSIDSFILTTIIGILTLFSTFIIFQIVRKKLK